MGSEKPSFLSQPVVKNIFMFRNGDPYYEARRLVINQKRVSNFETLLREVTGGIQAPFGAVRNIYTPRGGHKVDSLDNIQSGEQYVAGGREKFKKLDYLQISSRKRRMLQSLPLQAKPLPPNRISVSARFLKPIKEPCPIFVVANGDTLNPAIRLLIHQRMLSQFERILEMISEKMGLRVLGGARSLYTYEGQQVTDGTQLESGQLYVAVGRERFKKLSYTDLLFSKPRGAWRVNGLKMGQLPPLYRSPKQNGNRKSVVRSTDSGNGETKASPPNHSGTNGEHLSSIVREISRARLLSLRLKRSGQSMTLCDNGLLMGAWVARGTSLDPGGVTMGPLLSCGRRDRLRWM
nr:doublecortin domain-containing protein 2-like [Nerophis lumbriciformis]